MVEMNSDVKTMGIPINMQRVFNPLVEAATLRLQESQIGNFNVAIEDLNVSLTLTAFLNNAFHESAGDDRVLNSNLCLVYLLHALILTTGPVIFFFLLFFSNLFHLAP